MSARTKGCYCNHCIAWSHILSINYTLETLGRLMVEDAAGQTVMDKQTRKGLYKNASRLVFEREHVWWAALKAGCAKNRSWSTDDEYRKIQHDCQPLWIRSPKD